MTMMWLRARCRDWCNYRRLSVRERRSLLLAMLLLPLLVIVHRGLGLRRARAMLDAMDIDRAAIGFAQSGPEHARLARSESRIVQIASRRGLLTPTCLQQSLFLHWWLARRGIASSLRIGVRKRNGALEAHAWVEHLGQALNDAADGGERFAPFDACFATTSRST